MMFNNIPEELQRLNQWVCWRLIHTDKGALTKVPFCPSTGELASVTDPKTWVSFNDAVTKVDNYSGIGFVLTKDDDYTIIDLDKPINEEQASRHARILQEFESYAELSQSREGVHIVVKGQLPKGMRKDKVEVYSDERYMIFTGDIINRFPIKEYQDKLDILISEATQEYQVTYLELHEYNREMTLEDGPLIDTAMNADNGVKFKALWGGDWQHDYPSQSEADYALLSILAFYSQNNEQVRRLFRSSMLGQRTKAMLNNKYIDRGLLKIRGSAPPEIDTTELLKAAKSVVLTPTAVEYRDNTTFPTGIVGDIADYIFQTSKRPVKEMALMAAMGLVAGIAGRAYNVSDTGLNLYLLLVSKTGRGKEGMAKGIEAMFKAVEDVIPSYEDFIGPGVFASGQALTKALDTKPCFISLLAEFGDTFQQMTDIKASAHMVMLRKVMLDLYAKSGIDDVLRPTVYSDVDKNTVAVKAPSATFLCETEPKGFFAKLTERQVSSGLLPRFSVVEYTGKRPRMNKTKRYPPSELLTKNFAALLEKSLLLQHEEKAIDVDYTKEAEARLDQYDIEVDDKINNATGTGMTEELWNRAHLKVLKISALLAVGSNIHTPQIQLNEVEWAIKFVNTDVKCMLAKFEEGSIGEGSATQEHEIRKVVERYMNMSKLEKRNEKISASLIQGHVIPYRFLKKNLISKPAFTTDKLGATTAIERALYDMVKDGSLVKVDRTTARVQFKTQAVIYGIGDNWHN